MYIRNLDIRMICLVREEEIISGNIKLRPDLIENAFPSIWLELKQNHKQNILIGGFYREWSNEGLLSLDKQLEAIKLFTKQIETADNEHKKINVVGDANLCSSKWNEEGFKLKTVAEEIQGTLACVV